MHFDVRRMDHCWRKNPPLPPTEWVPDHKRSHGARKGQLIHAKIEKSSLCTWNTPSHSCSHTRNIDWNRNTHTGIFELLGQVFSKTSRRSYRPQSDCSQLAKERVLDRANNLCSKKRQLIQEEHREHLPGIQRTTVVPF